MKHTPFPFFAPAAMGEMPGYFHRAMVKHRLRSKGKEEHSKEGSDDHLNDTQALPYIPQTVRFSRCLMVSLEDFFEQQKVSLVRDLPVIGETDFLLAGRFLLPTSLCFGLRIACEP